MDTSEKEQLIQSYLTAYNQQDVSALVETMDEQIVFKNYSQGQKTHEMIGKAEFQRQAEEALTYFSERNQKAEEFTHNEIETEVLISYWAIAAIDLPNGLKKGQKFELKGKSVFRFSEGKIIEIRDYS